MKRPAKDNPLYKHDTPLVDRIDLLAALGLLTRLPISVDGERAVERGAASAWAYPLVGVIVGVICATAATLLAAVGLPAGIVAGLILALSVILTGAMHEDGLADSADGLWGGWDKARRLAIMKDSHIGVYGVCAIALSLLLRWLALSTIIAMGAYWVALIAVGALSRCAMVVVMATLLPARNSGLGKSVGPPPTNTAWLAIVISIGVAVLTGYPLLVLFAALASLACGLIASAKVGGQTGDILGATQQVTETVTLIALVTMIT
ncbi:adenosylcobinamide-GDP ribazoletransferase [Cognatiyoonia sp. IB215446]|uniref:adenosylcobinamide-GDP ribazoletransferase n=1 Tax=Cognatiyoonia sp. IB215446 TaxID=3097355 RepID=UPI002A132EC8|nr:adenosylcobinamide-GDP ribazoletransferase [Cognatiyoonia sp. IB215446]MDX8348298.1 adenosylcobinamide-GDP ribazoletransferase [Cognatiyoonia sp. IB215446]